MQIQYNWENKLILVAEDEEINYLLINEILKKTKVKLIRAINGEEALSFFSENKDIDLVIMDVKMPKINGYEATAAIKKIRKVPVIAQTAYAMAGEEQESLKAGCDAYITKPINVSNLLSLISSFLDK